MSTSNNMVCLEIHQNVMHRFRVQALQDTPLCNSADFSPKPAYSVEFQGSCRKTIVDCPWWGRVPESGAEMLHLFILLWGAHSTLHLVQAGCSTLRSGRRESKEENRRGRLCILHFIRPKCTQKNLHPLLHNYTHTHPNIPPHPPRSISWHTQSHILITWGSYQVD